MDPENGPREWTPSIDPSIDLGKYLGDYSVMSGSDARIQAAFWNDGLSVTMSS
ncbi:hypothetical protein Poly30_16320 [Planctomycetes bacterium Poly30]|uniref:Uncharacterized protein n=1 Tax=Saltatorellus ferox TaxID=2528018 RepID=A0A518EPW1_9BACT|nr:hypothetical protein Poly30_16320 [Planctomycetes bacterium Poly30]